MTKVWGLYSGAVYVYIHAKTPSVVIAVQHTQMSISSTEQK